MKNGHTTRQKAPAGRRRMEPLRRPVCPALGWMGRHSLLLYLLHQPVIYGVLSAAAVLFA